MKTKKCERCKKVNIKIITNKKYCEKCSKNKDREDKIKWYWRNRDKEIVKAKGRRKKRYLIKKEEIKEKQRDYWLKNKKYYKAKSKEYRYKNKLRVKKKFNEWKEKNPDYYKKYNRTYFKNRRKSDQRFKIAVLLRNRLKQAINKYLKNGYYSTSRKYRIDYKSIIEHLKPFPKDLSKYHIHHIQPLFTFDLTKKDEIERAFKPKNHIWIKAEEHRKLNHHIK